MKEKQEVTMLTFEMNVIASSKSEAQYIGLQWLDELKGLFIVDAWKLTVTAITHGSIYAIHIAAT